MTETVSDELFAKAEMALECGQVLDGIDPRDILALRATPSRDGTLREAAKVAVDLTGYTGEGTEDQNDGFGMFARGVRYAKRRISVGILALVKP